MRVMVVAEQMSRRIAAGGRSDHKNQSEFSKHCIFRSVRRLDNWVTEDDLRSVMSATASLILATITTSG